MQKFLFTVVFVAVACSPGESADTTTSSSTTSTSTSTTGVPPTTQPAPTTTTLTPTTTSALSTTTTSSDLLEGNWADAALVTTDFGALGWWDGSGWVEAGSEGSLPVDGGEDYQTVLLDEVATTTAGPETTVCEPLGLIGVELDDPDLLGDYPGPYGVAVSAPWPLQPHLVDVAGDDGTYAGFAADLLSSRGLDVADPVIKQVLRVDLEGDGVNEVLVIAEEVTTGFLMEEGDYSIAFLRKVIEDEVQTAVLEATVVLDESDQFAGAHSVGGVADLNDDGKMEIITNSAFFEGFSVAAWEYVDDDLGPVKVLEIGCGS